MADLFSERGVRLLPSEIEFLRHAAEVYAIAKFYAREGDPEMERRVLARVASAGYTEGDLEAALQRRAAEIIAAGAESLDGEA